MTNSNSALYVRVCNPITIKMKLLTLKNNLTASIDIGSGNDYSSITIIRKNFDGTRTIINGEMTDEKDEESLINKAKELVAQYESRE